MIMKKPKKTMVWLMPFLAIAITFALVAVTPLAHADKNKGNGNQGSKSDNGGSKGSQGGSSDGGGSKTPGPVNLPETPYAVTLPIALVAVTFFVYRRRLKVQ